MAKIFISYSYADKVIIDRITAELQERGHEIIIDTNVMEVGQEFRKSLLGALKSADGVLVLITDHSLQSKYVISEIGAARAFIDETTNKKFLIPVLYNTIDIPNIIQDLYCIFLNNEDFITSINLIDQSISRFIGRKEAEKENEGEVREKIESKATDYIEAATTTLNKRELENKVIAITCYALGFIALILGALFGFFGLKDALNLWSENIWIYVITIIKSTVIIGLLVASSKYAFDLGRSFMHESLRSADRIHAIHFGNFYLQAFGSKDSSPKELVEIFNWNIDSTTSSFLKMDSNNYDPKFTEKLIEVTKILSDKVKLDK
jgi:hypothetical protein